jgi:hypothetical protein
MHRDLLVAKENLINTDKTIIPEVKDAKEGVDFIYDTYNGKEVRKYKDPVKVHFVYCEPSKYNVDADDLAQFMQKLLYFSYTDR